MDIYYIIITIQYNILQCIKKLKSKEMDIYYNMINLIDKRSFHRIMFSEIVQLSLTIKLKL